MKNAAPVSLAPGTGVYRVIMKALLPFKTNLARISFVLVNRHQFTSQRIPQEIFIEQKC